jgi:hypothetical protein
MPYVNIPESGLGGAVAKLVGKIQGKLSSNVLSSVTALTNKLNVEGCPTGNQLERLRGQMTQLDSTLNSVDSRLAKFKKLPKALKVPVAGLKAAKKLILILPIPQAVPPGFGLPVNVTTKYADLLHMLKELIIQAEELIKSIEIVLDSPSNAFDSLKSNIGRVDNALKSCEAQAALQREIDAGRLTTKELQNIGLVDEDEIFIFSSLGPVLLAKNSNTGIEAGNSSNTSDLRYRGKWQHNLYYHKNEQISYSNKKWICLKDHTSDINGGKETGLPGIGPWSLVELEEGKAIDTLNNSLKRLNDSSINQEVKDNIRRILDTLVTPTSSERISDDRFYHTGPNGEVYKLEIQIDENSPSIAPRRYAVALDKEGVAVLSGPKSFSSSVQILLDELKFRIDNQLP